MQQPTASTPGLTPTSPSAPSASLPSTSNPSTTANKKSALSYPIVDTGQVKCYDNSKEISFPIQGASFYGQDAQHQSNQPAYRDNGDGTITDLNTGLMWQQDPGDKMTYEEAVANASSLNLAGHDDWRLPTIKELYSLILFSGTDPSGPESSSNLVPFIDTNYFNFKYGDTSAGERIIDAQYWSRTEYVGTTMNGNATVFGVNFADGRIKGYPRDTGLTGQPMKQFVRYVRGNLNYGINNFVDNGDGTITDTATGLMWSKADSGEGMDWEDALAWVQRKNDDNYLGHNDWRLPNAKELQSIVDYTRAPDVTNSAAIDPIFNITSITNEGGESDYPFFWASTTHANSTAGGGSAVYIAFGRALGYMSALGEGRQMPPGGQIPPEGQVPPGGQMPPWQQQVIGPGNYQLLDVHGAGAQRCDPKSGSVSAYPHGLGPQGDVVRIYNYVRCVRDINE